MTEHEQYIQRAITIAKSGLGTTHPNPSVGAVIVCDGKIIGEGFTSSYGAAHAEVNAIASVKDKLLLSKATIYVTLEPCSHYGKTPPCADLIIKHKIPRVVIGCLDPHEKVAGQGVQKLKDAGCEVIIGILEKECNVHHKRFLTFHQKKRPYIILKWAETIDGFIAPQKEKRNKSPEPFWITNTHSRQLVHQWRSEEHAILVGTNTVLEDNPKLDVRHWIGENPIRIVLDKNLKIGRDHHIFDGKTKTIVITENDDPNKYVDGIKYEHIDFSKDIGLQISKALYNHQILSVLIEGGAKTLQTFIDADLWDEARVFIGRTAFEKGTAAPKLKGNLMHSAPILSDTLYIFEPC